FLKLERASFAYKCPPFVIDLIENAARLDQIADVRQGLATSDNSRFLRFIWDVQPKLIGRRWFPYTKGAGSTRWVSPQPDVGNWENGGAEIKEAVGESYPYLNGKTAWVVKNEQFYFRRGLCFPFVNSRVLAVRLPPSGSIFDVAASALFMPADMR